MSLIPPRRLSCGAVLLYGRRTSDVSRGRSRCVAWRDSSRAQSSRTWRKKASSEAFLRRDPALTQKLVFLFRKTDTKTYQFWNCRRLTGRWSCIGWKSAGNDTKTYHHLFPLDSCTRVWRAVACHIVRKVLSRVISSELFSNQRLIRKGGE